MVLRPRIFGGSVQNPFNRLLFLAAVWLSLLLGSATVWAQAPDPETPFSAQGVFASARARLLQIRTLLASAEQQSSIGSGFLVTADGLAITNYHVVSQFALEPQTYRLFYTASDGSKGPLQVLAIDIANDLAVVRLDRKDLPFFQLGSSEPQQSIAKGERLFSMGNPLDLGLTIVEGTYNGLVDRSYTDRIHFSGAINPGMSGGPTVTADGRVVGINVSKLLGGDLVSFLVPVKHAAALLDEARNAEPLSPSALRAEIGRQLTAWQAGLYDKLGSGNFRLARFGPYLAPESDAPWFTCWAQTNADQMPKPRATIDTTSCASDTPLFIASDLSTGLIYLTHSYIHSVDLNQFQFAAVLSVQSQPPPFSGRGQRWHTDQRCHEDFVAGGDDRPPLRVIWCARAYREFAGLYDVSVMTVTEDHDRQALVTRLSLQGVSYDNAVAMAQRLIGMVQWAK
jgi:serine protease Do